MIKRMFEKISGLDVGNKKIKKTKKMKKKGFTLIELSVVIAIIAILAAMLLSVLSRAREKARQVGCMGNLKEIGQATMMYADDYNGITPKPASDPNPDISWNLWNDVLYNGGYIKERDILVCPSWPPNRYLDHRLTLGIITEVQAEYGIQNQNPSNYVRFYRIRNPSNYIYYTDSIDLNPSHPDSYRKQRWRVSIAAWAPYQDTMHLRHTGLADCWFVDGHVEACNKTRIKEVFVKIWGPLVPIRVAEKDGTIVQINP